jgi:TldD protein
MLDKSIAANVIAMGLESGADFVDLFVEKTQIQTVSYKSSKVDQVQSGINSGIGIRLIFGDQSLYAHSNSLDEKTLLDIITKLAAINKRAPKNSFSGSFNTGSDFHHVKVFAKAETELKEKIQTLATLDQMIRNKDEKIAQVAVSLIQKQQQVEIFDSEGLHRFDERPYIRLATSVVAKDGDKQTSAFDGPGAIGGWEFVQGLDLKKITDGVTQRVLTILDADLCPAGTMPVVLENGFGGVIFHEACGHLLETTSVEKKASVFWDKKGEQIAHSEVSAVDDGTIDREWGSISIDDEGMPTQKTQLIKDGVLTNFLCDRMGEIKTGHARTGSARRQNYKFSPASRMRNTYIEPGNHSRGEILASIDNGLYCKAMGGGSVNPATGEFNFSVEEAYMVKDGKLGRPVRGATLIGKGSEILKKISMVGKDCTMTAGMCGSVSGSVPVTVGQPPLKVDNILVGGQA